MCAKRRLRWAGVGERFLGLIGAAGAPYGRGLTRASNASRTSAFGSFLGHAAATPASFRSSKNQNFNQRPVRTSLTANGVVRRKFHVDMPVRKNTTQAYDGPVGVLVQN